MLNYAKRGLAALLLLALAGCLSSGATDLEKRQNTVDLATQTINEFIADPDKTWFRQHIGGAKGVLIVPRLVKAGFIFGGSGGNAVLLGRGATKDDWSYPAFYSLGAVTFGLQIGGEVSNVLMLVMTQSGMDALLSTDVKLGADASIAVGPVGTGVAAQTADILLFSRDKGLFGGLTVEGSVVSPRPSYNEQYYGKPARSSDITIVRDVSNPGADALRKAVADASL
ncbi:MAG: lipid-binding SYLF domain-containing protein [Alphaproteobacteria bacterium]|nr:lipid-binding SYLF domain-containing protein [Alphaproteobacteria bacterium]